MSSGFVSKNGDIIGFEINHNNIQGNFTMTLLPPEFDADGEQRVSIKFTTQSYKFPDSMIVSNQVMITKSYTKVLSHFFRHMADHMDKWYKKDVA